MSQHSEPSPFVKISLWIRHLQSSSEPEDWMDDWKSNRQGVLKNVHTHLGNARRLYSQQQYEKMRLEDERHDLALVAAQAEKALHTEDCI